jgi:GNAT superfamily N-acetyltransferase
MVYHPATLPGFIAWQVGERIGLVTYHLEVDGCEIVTLDSQRPGIGVGTALIEAVRRVAQEAACHRLRVITTNDNLEALRFYQKRGFRLVAVHPRAMEASRRLKPEIPLIGQHGIPLRDEIELEMPLG